MIWSDFGGSASFFGISAAASRHACIPDLTLPLASISDGSAAYHCGDRMQAATMKMSEMEYWILEPLTFATQGDYKVAWYLAFQHPCANLARLGLWFPKPCWRRRLRCPAIWHEGPPKISISLSRYQKSRSSVVLQERLLATASYRFMPASNGSR